MLIPPALEIFVLWHPDDSVGEDVASTLLEHFHGTAFSGLVGGAVEVYVRSEGWSGPDTPPRPLPFMEETPGGLADSAVTVVVPIWGVNLARALEKADSPWLVYLEQMVSAASSNATVGIFNLVADSTASSADGHLARVLGTGQALDKAGASNASVLCRDLAHSITGFVNGGAARRLRVFISHTKRYSLSEEPDRVTELVHSVRDIIGTTHMSAFFDEADLQPGANWEQELKQAAETSAMLIVRTDIYASRDWCQREILAAKQADMPVVVLQALHEGEDRGSFLMDHVPSVALSRASTADIETSIESALNKLVDEALKRALWRQQRAAMSEYGFDWLPANAPEPLTLAHWLRTAGLLPNVHDKIFVLHPDPPLGAAEVLAIEDILAIGSIDGLVEILTPRTFATRGGQVRK